MQGRGLRVKSVDLSIRADHRNVYQSLSAVDRASNQWRMTGQLDTYHRER